MKGKVSVFKFGGASVQDADAIRHVGQILAPYKGSPLVVVISAMGKTTNALEKVVGAFQDGKLQEAVAFLEEIKLAHYEVCRVLFGEQHEIYHDINDHFATVEWELEEEPEDNYDYKYDQIVSLGELISTAIVAAYLRKTGLDTHWLDARDVIITDDIFREGWVQWPQTEKQAQQKVIPLLDAQKIVITQGFIGQTVDNLTTTLGREGSDYTAAIFSYCLGAESMTIWKDVPGVLTGDPRRFDNVSKLDRLSYKEAIEMTYYGAQVIHPKTIKPLQNKNISLYVKSFINPEGEGTFISGEVEDTYPPIVAVIEKQALCHISTRDFSFVAERHLHRMFQFITDLRLQVNMMQNTAISFNVCFNDADGKVDRFAKLLEEDFKVMITRDLELITVRHHEPRTMESLRRGKVVLLEERLPATIQMVVKSVPVMKRKTTVEK